MRGTGSRNETAGRLRWQDLDLPVEGTFEAALFGDEEPASDVPFFVAFNNRVGRIRVAETWELMLRRFVIRSTG